MKVGIASFDREPDDTIRLAVRAEKIGLKSFWISDHLMDYAGAKIDPWSTIGAIARETKRLTLGSWVTDSQRCHPAKLAQTLATLSHISSNRVTLGIGAGEAMNLIPFGIPFDDPESRLSKLSEAIQVVRLLWKSSSRNPVSFDGQFFKLNNAWLNLGISGKIPIYLGIFGSSKGLELIGEFGDGWLAWINSPETFRKRAEMVRKAAKESGRDPRTLDLAVPIYACISTNKSRIKSAMDDIKRTLVKERRSLRMMGFRDAFEGKNFQNVLVDERETKAQAAQYKLIPDEIAERFLVYGSVAELAERMEDFRSVGATHAILIFRDHADEQLSVVSRSRIVDN